MKKIIAIVLTLSASMMLTGCGTSDKTYVQEAPLPELTPTNGTNIIVSAEGESNVGLTYTEIGDGSILIECGDGNDYSCGTITVYEATETNSSI